MNDLATIASAGAVVGIGELLFSSQTGQCFLGLDHQEAKDQIEKLPSVLYSNNSIYSSRYSQVLCSVNSIPLRGPGTGDGEDCLDRKDGGQLG